MRFTHIPEHTVTIPSSRPVYLDGGEEAVLLIHGYNSYPEAMRYLGEQLNTAGYTVSIPRLPGHGTNRQDFVQTSWKDWLRRCIDEYIELQSVHQKVHVGGHSMGGLITIILASIFQPEKIALYAPALIAKNKLLPFTPILKHFFPFLPRKTRKLRDDFNDEESLTGESLMDKQYMREEYWSWYLGHPISQLYLLQRRARKVLNQVRSNVLTIVSKADRKIPLRVTDLIDRKISSRKKVVVLEKSIHELIHGVDKKLVAEETIGWFKTNS